MNRSLTVCRALLLTCLCACTTGLTAAGRGVEVATAATDRCEDLGKIYGSGGGGGYTTPEAKKRSAANELRNRAGDIGGNLVVIDEPNPETPKAPPSAQAFRCGDEVVAAPAQPAPAVAPVAAAPTATATAQDEAPVAGEAAASAPGAPAPVVTPPEERLKKLQALLQQGLITQEEHDAQRAEIIQSL